MITQEKLLGICFDKIVSRWNDMPTAFPDFLRVFSEEEQKANSLAIKRLRPHLKSALPNLFGKNSDSFVPQLKAELGEFVKNECIFYLLDNVPSTSLEDFERNFLLFVKRTKDFDKRIKPAEVWQALRNYLIYCMIELMERRPLDCRDIILAFSLLYPYTDNFIDSRYRSGKEKDRFNELVRTAILEKEVTPTNRYEEKTKRLVQMVQNEYELGSQKRAQASSLLMDMLVAQERSMRQKSAKRNSLSYDEILNLSVNKGSYSVIIDYLFAIDLDLEKTSDKSLEFYLAFGLMLQLVDDIQDISEDKGVSQTLMTTAKSTYELEKTTNQLFHFVHTYMSEYLEINANVKSFFTPLAELAVVSAIMRSSKYYSKEYLEKLKPHFPV